MFFKAFLDDNAYNNICQKCRKIRYISNQVLPMAISLIYMYIYIYYCIMCEAWGALLRLASSVWSQWGSSGCQGVPDSLVHHFMSLGHNLFYIHVTCIYL